MKRLFVLLTLVCAANMWAPSSSIQALMRRFETGASEIAADVTDIGGREKNKPQKPPKPAGLSKKVKAQKAALAVVKKKPPVAEKPTCPVCLEGLSSNSVTLSKKGEGDLCGHSFHKNCLEEWVTSKNCNKRPNDNCPVCRENLSNTEKAKFGITHSTNTDMDRAFADSNRVMAQRWNDANPYGIQLSNNRRIVYDSNRALLGHISMDIADRMGTENLGHFAQSIKDAIINQIHPAYTETINLDGLGVLYAELREEGNLEMNTLEHEAFERMEQLQDEIENEKRGRDDYDLFDTQIKNDVLAETGQLPNNRRIVCDSDRVELGHISNDIVSRMGTENLGHFAQAISDPITSQIDAYSSRTINLDELGSLYAELREKGGRGAVAVYHEVKKRMEQIKREIEIQKEQREAEIEKRKRSPFITVNGTVRRLGDGGKLDLDYKLGDFSTLSSLSAEDKAKIKKISLRYNDIRDLPHAVFYEFPNLVEIDLSNNPLDGTISPYLMSYYGIQQLKKLSGLDLEKLINIKEMLNKPRDIVAPEDHEIYDAPLIKDVLEKVINLTKSSESN